MFTTLAKLRMSNAAPKSSTTESAILPQQPLEQQASTPQNEDRPAFSGVERHEHLPQPARAETTTVSTETANEKATRDSVHVALGG